MFTENSDASAPSFSNYQLGGGFTYNLNRFLGVEGEVSSSIGLSQSLDFGYPSTVRTPDVLSYSGNVVVSVPSGSSVVPYVTGGVGALSLFSREAFGIDQTETLLATNVGGGVKWYAGRWGLRGDYRFLAVPSKDESVAVFRPRSALRTPRVWRSDVERRPVTIQAALNGTRSCDRTPRSPDHSSRDKPRRRGPPWPPARMPSTCTSVTRRAASRSRRTDLAETIKAIRDACPGIPLGISTGAWIVPGLRQRLALIRSWKVLPDFASVNLHEEGAAQVMRLLLDKGVGVEAGVWNAPSAVALLDSGLTSECARILLEPAEASCWARVNLLQIERVLKGSTRPILLHGLGRYAWDFIALAARRGYDTRVGFEDTLKMPDGTRAASNADLVTAARRIILSVRTATEDAR